MTQPQYTIRLSREEIKRNPSAYDVSDTGVLLLLIKSTPGGTCSVLLDVDYYPKGNANYTADQMIRRHLAHAWRENEKAAEEGDIGSGVIATQSVKLLIDMARELYPNDPCALADLLAESYERGTTPLFTATWTTLDPEQLPDLDDPDSVPF